MRFMIIRMADGNTEAGVMPSEAILGAMGKFAEEMCAAGVMLGGEGLKRTAEGARVKFTGGKPTVIDGPFTESKELIAGYFLIQTGSLQEAIEWASRWPAIDMDGDVQLEIRPLFEADDFGEEFTPEMREAEQRIWAEAAARGEQARKV